ncbi:MAG TPA: iron-containing alcohol dehydrogenase [Streptosporangiaceae bacterium]
MQSFTYDAPPGRVVFGSGTARAGLADEVSRLGVSQLLLITTPRAAALARELAAPLGGRVAGLFTGVREHVPAEVAGAARQQAAETGADAVLSIGGGSATGTAKAVALTTGLPVIAVPTTYAGSEVTPVWGLTEGERKTTGTDPRVRPQVVIYDPDLTVSLPPELTAASGLNALAHCTEAFWAPGHNPVTALAAAEAIRMLAQALPLAVKDGTDLAARGDVLYGAYLAGTAFGTAGAGLQHKICHVLGGRFGLPHAQTHAIVLPYVLAVNLPGAPDAAARISQALEGAALDSTSPAAVVQALAARLGLPGGLRDIGLREDQIDEAVRLIEPVMPAGNPVPVGAAELGRLLRAAWAGAPVVSAPVVSEAAQPATGDAAVQAAREAAVTAEVLASFAGAPPRYREVAQSLVRNLHAFAREIRLTQEEWQFGIDFLTRAGHITDDRRQEFILLSDVLGMSMLTIGINAPAAAGATESTVVGPFFVAGAPETPLGGDIANGAHGQPCYVSGTVTDTAGQPMAGARIDVWQSDEDGFYDVQYPDGRTAARGWLRTGPDGGYRFWSVHPAPYPIPDDGPVGDLLKAAGRGPMRPAHLHFRVAVPGYRPLVTHIFVAGDPYLDRDAVFGVKESLITEFTEHPPGPAPEDRTMREPWRRVTFDMVLAPAADQAS